MIVENIAPMIRLDSLTETSQVGAHIKWIISDRPKITNNHTMMTGMVATSARITICSSRLNAQEQPEPRNDYD